MTCVQNYPQFWPVETGVEVSYGSLAVETLDVDEDPSIIIRSFRLRRVIDSILLNNAMLHDLLQLPL